MQTGPEYPDSVTKWSRPALMTRINAGIDNELNNIDDLASDRGGFDHWPAVWPS